LWFGIAGVVAFVVVLIAIRAQNAQAWTAALSKRSALAEAPLDTTGAAYVGIAYASRPLVRIMATPTEMLILGRWRWIPVQPVDLLRSDLSSARVDKTFTGFRRIRLELSTSRPSSLTVWVSQRDLALLREIGWDLPD
jgi:hypothetical protein